MDTLEAVDKPAPGGCVTPESTALLDLMGRVTCSHFHSHIHLPSLLLSSVSMSIPTGKAHAINHTA